MRDTLLVVDVQNDFLDGGKLPIEGADENFLERIEKIIPLFKKVIFTADAHPKNHCSFKEIGEHCVVGTDGAEIPINSSDTSILLNKGEQATEDELSAFKDGKNIEELEGDIYVLGLVGEYDVKQTILDLVEFYDKGKIYAITDLIKSLYKGVYGSGVFNIDYFNGRVNFVDTNKLLVEQELTEI